MQPEADRLAVVEREPGDAAEQREVRKVVGLQHPDKLAKDDARFAHSGRQVVSSGIQVGLKVAQHIRSAPREAL